MWAYYNYFKLSPPHLILPAPRQGTAPRNVSGIEKNITFSASDEVGTVLQYFKRLFNAESDRVDTTRMDKTAGKTYDKMERQPYPHLGPVWPRIARDRRLWRQFRERFLLTE